MSIITLITLITKPISNNYYSGINGKKGRESYEKKKFSNNSMRGYLSTTVS